MSDYPVGAIVNLSDESLSDEELSTLQRQWEKFQRSDRPLRSIIIDRRLLFVPLVPEYPPTPGDDI